MRLKPIFALALFGFAPMTSAKDSAPEVIAQGLAFPEGPALSPDGKTLYVVNVQEHFISRIDLKSKRLTRAWLTLPDGGRGNGAMIGPDGALYVADVGAKRIDRVSLPDGAVTVVADKDPAGNAFRGPNDVAFDARGNLYFTDPDGTWDKPVASVYRVDAKTRAVTTVADGLRFPNGLALSRDGGTLYVAQSPLSRIDAVDLKTGVRREWAKVDPSGGGPDGVRLGKGGFIYASIFGAGEVVQINKDGQTVRRIPVGVGKNNTNLCFTKDGKTLYVTETQSNSVVRIRL